MRASTRRIERVVTRYRFKVDHGFMAPDWREIKRWASVALTLGPPHCGAVPRNGIRARFHVGPRPMAAAGSRSRSVSAAASESRPPSGPLSVVRDRPARAVEIIALARRAKAAADARQPAQATRLAEAALAAFDGGLGMEDLDGAAAIELADWIAAAQFHAVELEADAFLRRELPIKIDPTWASEVGASLESDRQALRADPGSRAAADGRAVVARRGRAACPAAPPCGGAPEQGGQGDAAEAERKKARGLVAGDHP